MGQHTAGPRLPPHVVGNYCDGMEVVAAMRLTLLCLCWWLTLWPWRHLQQPAGDEARHGLRETRTYMHKGR